MLTSLRAGVCTLATATVLIASSAQADDLTVLILEGAYFPPVVSAQIGDTIVFVNETDSEHTVSGDDEIWTSGPIPTEGSYRLALNETTPLTFGGDWVDGSEMTGQFSLE
ncbi:hypothetical protein SAMN04488523_104269 [Sulfitobacter brevis]|uniref:Plastocyanin n=1 Tax=Sulfitobacter brevis TaxID=74348 RepID=A0A1I1X789_9RHOB|nr:hypothetical protein [Sulfitobacter brevis]SFE03249.1 hypothetical protein SAMN04488523_104269 [Sulfitobacter brevis]